MDIENLSTKGVCYVKQGQYGVAKNCKDVRFIETDKVSTCTIVVLKNRDSGSVLFMHVDTITRAWRSRSQINKFLSTGEREDRYSLLFTGGGYKGFKCISLSRCVRAIIKSHVQKALPCTLSIVQNDFRSYSKNNPPVYDMTSDDIIHPVKSSIEDKSVMSLRFNIVLAGVCIVGVIWMVLYMLEQTTITGLDLISGRGSTVVLLIIFIYTLYIGNPFGQLRPASFMRNPEE